MSSFYAGDNVARYFFMKNFILNKESDEQLAIINAVKSSLVSDSHVSLMIQAYAGSGKTSTLVLVAKALLENNLNPSELVFLTFAKFNRLDLSNKLSEFGLSDCVKTFNSYGFSVLRKALSPKSIVKFTVDPFKYSKIAQSLGYLDSFANGSLEPGSLELILSDAFVSFSKLLDRVRTDALALDEINNDVVADIAFKCDLEFDRDSVDILTGAVVSVLKEGLSYIEKKFYIDFLDQVWYPWHQRNNPVFSKAFRFRSKMLRVIGIDECQDLNPLQVEFLKLLYNPDNNFLVAVGDRYQAIYAFRGAYGNSVDDLSNHFNCKTLPLSISWRCGSNHLELVRNTFAWIKIKNSPSAFPGEIKLAVDDDCKKIFEPNEKYLVVCRSNRSLFLFALKLIENKISFSIKYFSYLKNFITDCKQTVSDIFKSLPVNSSLPISDRIVLWHKNILSLEKGVLSSSRLEELSCYKAFFLFLCDNCEFEKLNPFLDCIDSFFEACSGDYPIKLSTIHAAKGLEEKNVVFVYPEQISAHTVASASDSSEQENNLVYVGLTRCLVNSDSGGVLWMVLNKGTDGLPFKWPDWLPVKYRKLGYSSVT